MSKKITVNEIDKILDEALSDYKRRKKQAFIHSKRRTSRVYGFFRIGKKGQYGLHL